MQKKILLGLIILISPIFLLAHNPLSAVYRLESQNDGGVLKIYLTQAAVNKTLKDIHGVDFINTLGEKDFKELIVSYIKDNIGIVINGSAIELEKGGIRYGNHETDLTFITSALPETINNIDLKITSFKDNEYHQTIFYLRKNDGTSEKIVLNSKNDFEAKINFEKTEDSFYLIIVSIIIIGLVVLALIAIKHKKKK
jgi:hypothetical protein